MSVESIKITEIESLQGLNGVHMTMDSLRSDVAREAETPTLDEIHGPPMKAITLCTYTPASHAAMWLGHMPTVIDEDVPWYNETVIQPWRITTGPARDAGKNCGLLFRGNNVIDGYNRLGYFTFGIGGVSQFSSGSFLRTRFPWDEFVYYGVDMDEEPLAPRENKTFPLNHSKGIASRLEGDRWFLFVNCPEPHYPYDWGEGIGQEIQEECFSHLKHVLNLRSHTASREHLRKTAPYAEPLKKMQLQGMEALDKRVQSLLFALSEVSNRPFYVFIMGDHGENFGERDLWGHMHPTRACLEVPLWMFVISP